MAEVIEKPRLRRELRESLPFQLDRDKFEGDRVRALVRLLRSVDPPVPRGQILTLPALSNLSILRQPQGTNFKVSPAEAEVIEGLLSQKMESNQPMDN